MKKHYDNKSYKILEKVLIGIVSILGVFMLVPSLNPTNLTTFINNSSSLFTIATSYSKLTGGALRAIRLGWVSNGDFIVLYIGALLLTLGIIAGIIGSALAIGNIKFKNLSQKINTYGLSGSLLGIVFIFISYAMFGQSKHLDRVGLVLPFSVFIFLALTIVAIGITVFLRLTTPKADAEEEYKMSRPNQLLLMYLPFAVLIFVFSYMPLWGWRLAFFDYTPGKPLSMEDFVGFKWIKFLFSNPATRKDIGRVMVNTLAMSGLGILTSWLPMVFAMFLAEATSTKFKRFVQTFTTIPNFISWVIVYSLALAMFSSDGFVNAIFIRLGWSSTPVNYLMGDTLIWLKMWAWGTWKGLGWSAIIYIAAISSIDPQMYESADIDGANRWQKMWYITIPSLMSTYFVLLVLSVASVLSNGMDQYLVFENPTNTGKITVLDLFVYQLGIDKGNYPLSTLIGILKTGISLILLFAVNTFSKVVRDESIF